MKLPATLLVTVAALSADSLVQGERDRAMSHLHATRKFFLDSVANLTAAQWNFKAAPDRWSIAECAEHIAVSEDSLFDLVTKKIMVAPPSASVPTNQKEIDEPLLKRLVDRSEKAQAPEFLQPKRRWTDMAELVSHFKGSRDRTIAYVQSTPDNLRSHLAPHPAFKQLDAYQWILVIAGHSERHTLQINEVKQQPGYPK